MLHLMRLLASIAVLVLATGAQADVTISSGATQNMSCVSGICAPTARDAVLNAGDLENLLAAGNITVTTSGNGVQADNIDLAANVMWGAGVLTLEAWHRISVDALMKAMHAGAGLSIGTDESGSGGSLSFGDKGRIVFVDLSSSLAINGASYRSENDLKQLAYDVARHPDRAYALVDDYDAQGDGVYAAAPISSPLRGSFTGLGNSIFNLVVVNDSDDARVGLFGTLNRGGTISNIRLKNAILRERNENCKIAGIAGVSKGRIENSFVSGRIDGGDACVVGGIAAENLGEIVDAHSTNAVRGNANPVGGLVGFNEGTISNSSSSAKVSAADDSALGGLVGNNYGGRITTSFATGEVNAVRRSTASGGLVGYNNGSVANCYALGNVVRGGVTIGGFAGVNDTSGTIRTSYSTGTVPGGSGVGGFAGSELGAAGHDYWDTTTSGTDIGVGSGSSSGIKGLTTKQFQSGLPAGFDPATWAESATINNGFPYLINNPPPK